MLRTVSWVVLALVGVTALLLSLSSAVVGYTQAYPIAGISISEIAAGREAVLAGLRGTRGTAAAWAAAWASLFLAVVFGPYRKGDVITWWGILASALVLGAVAALRVPLVQISAGTAEPLVLLVLVIVALLLDVKRLTAPQQ